MTDPISTGTAESATSVSAEAARAFPAIHLVDMVKRYGNVTALAGLTMTVTRGEVFGLLGPNGAGKTTAVKLILGLAHPSSGEGYVLGAPLGDLATRRHIGYLPELFRYQEWLSAREVLALHCSLAQVPRGERDGQIDEVLALVGLTDRARDRVGTFSKGMQQRLGLGVALLGNPDLVVLDEPTSALDPVGRHDVRDIIHALKTRGATVFLNSHLLTEVEHVCDRIAVVDRGHVIAVSRVSDLTVDVHTARIRCSRLSAEQFGHLSDFGEMLWSDGWYTVHCAGVETIPNLVAALVDLGARIYAVEPGRHTLEQRFLEILKGSQDAGTDHRAAHAL